MKTKIFFDGGCRPNPGAMEAAVVVRGKLHHRPVMGTGSSEEAEWLALLYALEVAAELNLREIVLLGDAAGVIDQIQGAAKGRCFAQHLARFQSEAELFDAVRLRHVRRSQNLAGIALERLRQGL